MNKFTLDRKAPIIASRATQRIELSSIPGRSLRAFKLSRDLRKGKTAACSCFDLSSASKMDMEENLVEIVRQYTCLRKIIAKEYKDAIAKENSWKEVAAKVRKQKLLHLIASTDSDSLDG